MLIFSVFLFLILHTQTVFSAVGDESRRRCREYSKLNFSNPDSGMYPNIINGELAKDGEFPHMGILGFSNGRNRYFTCGCSLISDRFVLTAAHCTDVPIVGSPKVVRLGAVNLRGGAGVIYPIAKIIRNKNYKNVTNDIALLRLNMTVTFSRFIAPACLQVERNFDNSTVIATGWGAIEGHMAIVPDLRKVGLHIYTRRQCYSKNRMLLSSFNITEEMMGKLLICAGGTGNDEVDTCKGDSGGPLQILSSPQHYHIVGITVFGTEYCNISTVPSFYTRVSAYIRWIERNMQKYDVI